MKKTLYIFVLFIFLNCSSNFYKNSISEISNVEIKYENGKLINGKLNFPIYLNQYFLYFKSAESGKMKIKADEIAEITYKIPNENVVFSKMSIIGKQISTEVRDSQFLQLISKGKINLYKGYNYGFLYKKKKTKKFLQKTDLYYCKRENEKNLTLIYYVDNENNDELIKIKAQEYFSNYPEFRETIENKNFNPEFLIQFINKYNNENK